MPSIKEEIEVRLGINTRTMTPGLNEAKAKVNGFGDFLNDKSKSWGKIFKGFGVVGLVNSVVGLLTPATEAVSEFFGKWGERTAESNASISHWADEQKKHFSELNKARWKEVEDVKKAEKEIADARHDRVVATETDDERLARLKSEVNEAEKNVFAQGGSGLESERLKLKEIAIRAHAALEKEEDRIDKKKKDEEDETNRKARKKSEALAQNRENAKKAQDRLYATNDQMAKLAFKQGNEQYMSTIEELANNPNSYGSRDAREIQRLEADSRRVVGTFGVKGSDKNYLQANQKEIDRLKDGLKEAGFIEDDKYEKLQKTSEEQAGFLKQLWEKGFKLQEEEP